MNWFQVVSEYLWVVLIVFAIAEWLLKARSDWHKSIQALMLDVEKMALNATGPDKMAYVLENAIGLMPARIKAVVALYCQLKGKSQHAAVLAVCQALYDRARAVAA